jgi:hypothetical protein
MGILAVPGLVAVSLVLLRASTAKLSHGGTASERLWAAAEAGLAVGLLLIPGRAAGVVVTVTFGAFTLVHWRAHRSQSPGCNCFGVATTTVTPPRRAAALTAMVTLAGAAIATFGSAGVVSALLSHPAALAWVAPASPLLALLWYWLFTSGVTGDPRRVDPALTLVGTTARLLETRLSRRDALQKIALAGSALAVAPIRYLLYPGSALAAITLTPSDCASGLCTSGYTEFCCQINAGGVNTCPEGTFPGGWWMCTDYAGRYLCHDEGVRYYVDCNQNPGSTFPGGCHCGNNDCDNRRVACNVFRYGQCNTQVPEITAVVCRLILCENPSRSAALHCSSSVSVDDAVCDQDAPCLEPPAVELVGAGGA